MGITFEEALKHAAEQIMDDEARAFMALEGADVEIVKDVTGTPLAPGQPKMCLGNGDFPGFECCCDNCDFYLRCFPEEASELEEALRLLKEGKI